MCASASSDVASSSELDDHLERISRAIERIADRLGALEARADKVVAED